MTDNNIFVSSTHNKDLTDLRCTLQQGAIFSRCCYCECISLHLPLFAMYIEIWSNFPIAVISVNVFPCIYSHLVDSFSHSRR
jgi:hypothetical protein